MADNNIFFVNGVETSSAAEVQTALDQATSGISISVWNGDLPAKIPVLPVRDPYHAWAILCEEMADRPADSFRVHTVTGTNGKTTIAFILRHIFRQAQRKTGLLTTVITDTGDGQENDAAFTMPDAKQLQQFFGICLM